MTSTHDLEISKLQTDLKDAKAIALTTLRANGELGVVINFLEKSFACKDHVALGQQIFKVVRTFGLSCAVQLRVDTEAINICDHSELANDSPPQEHCLAPLPCLREVFAECF